MLIVNQKNIMDIIMDKIVDIHTHILPGIDDGAHDIDESVKLVNHLYNNGITDIVLTSHYVPDTSYNYNQLVRIKLLENLREKVDNDNIHLYLGNEVYLSENVIDLLEKHEISTINNTKYMLIELPLTGYLNNLQNIICDLTSYGIIPIIAHPERYSFIQKNKKRIGELLEFNCLLQCNVDSLVGKYGKQAKKVMKWLLKKNLVQFVATDTHSINDSKELIAAYSKLEKLVGKNKYIELTNINPTKVLNNQDVQGNLEYLIKEEKRS